MNVGGAAIAVAADYDVAVADADAGAGVVGVDGTNVGRDARGNASVEARENEETHDEDEGDDSL